MTTKSATKKCEVSQKVRLKSVNVQEMFPKSPAYFAILFTPFLIYTPWCFAGLMRCPERS